MFNFFKVALQKIKLFEKIGQFCLQFKPNLDYFYFRMPPKNEKITYYQLSFTKNMSFSCQAYYLTIDFDNLYR